MRDMLQTRSHQWHEVGLARQLSRRVVRKARWHTVVFALLLAGLVACEHYRRELFGVDAGSRAVIAALMLVIGWQLARDLGRALAPTLFRRLEPGAAGTVGFLARLATMAIAIALALHIAGVDPRTLAVGGAVTAVVLGLAAQQTVGNLFAGTVLLSARPFRVGERVRLQGGPLAGQIDGTVSSLGLLYTTFSNGDDAVLVPNSVVLSVAVTPLREPAGVNIRARLPLDVRPDEIQAMLEDAISVEVRSAPRIDLESIDGDEVVARVGVTPAHASQGSVLAAEVVAALRRSARGHSGGGSPEAAAVAEGAGTPR
jgi:small conductance mechanosensitive channel